MILYRVSWTDPYQGRCYHWAHTKANAEHFAKHTKRELYPDTSEVEFHVAREEIPTTKHGLASWLNRHFTRDNG